MGIKQSAKKWSNTLRLDKHHAIERFGVILSLLCLAFVLVTVGAWNAASEYSQSQLDKTALYTKEFQTSRTQLRGQVDGVYVNKDRSRTLVMMKFAKPADVATDAASYQAYLTGSNTNQRQITLNKKVKGQIISFGSTGYLGVVLNGETPFEQRILALTLRANDELVYTPNDKIKVSDDLKKDTSFAEHDQWRVYFNPGASGAKEVKALDKPGLDVGEIYAEIVTAEKESEVRDNLTQTLGKLRADLARIDSYEQELGRTSTADNDFLVPVRGKNPQPSVVSIAGDVMIDRETGKEATSATPVENLELKTTWLSPKGYDFDWRKGSVYEGYLNDIVPAGQKFGDYLTAKARKEVPDGLASGKIQWKLTDGTNLADSTSSKSVLAPLLQLQTNLEEAYSTYYQDKVEYQVTLPTQLLELEVTLRNVETTNSVNESPKTVIVY